MFNNNTVFLLGAGASWHYGYPTGEELVKKVAETAGEIGEFCKKNYRMGLQPDFVKDQPPQNFTDKWGQAASDCFQLCERIRAVNPLVIDYFLGLNPSLQDIGKLIIAVVLFRCEATFMKYGNSNRKEVLSNSPYKRDREEAKNLDITRYKDDWCRFLLHRLVTDYTESSDLPNNPVRFITFNYDISLEHTLFKGLSAIERFEPNHVNEFFSEEVFACLREHSCIHSRYRSRHTSAIFRGLATRPRNGPMHPWVE